MVDRIRREIQPSSRINADSFKGLLPILVLNMPKKPFDRTKPITPKQKRFVQILPQTNYNMAEAMRLAGYSAQSSNSGAQYGILRHKIAKYFEPEYVKAEIQTFLDKVVKEGDNSNSARMIELKSKITGLLKEANVTNVALFSVVDETKPETVPIDTVVDAPIADDIVDTVKPDDKNV